MKKAFDKITNSTIVVSVLSLILGIVLVAYPSISLEILGIISAVALILEGILSIALEIRLSKIYIPYENMLKGVLSIILGLVLLLRPESVAILLTIAFGVWIVMSGINDIKLALFFRKVKNSPWVLMLVMSILDIIVGLLVIVNPFSASIGLALYLGIMIIIHSVFTIVDVVILKKHVKDLGNDLKSKLAKFIPGIE